MLHFFVCFVILPFYHQVRSETYIPYMVYMSLVRLIIYINIYKTKKHYYHVIDYQRVDTPKVNN